MNKRYLFGGTLLVILAVLAVPASFQGRRPGTGNWPMWGGTPDRNMFSNMKGLPGEWDTKTGKNVKWVGETGIAKLRKSGGCRRVGVRRHK